MVDNAEDKLKHAMQRIAQLEREVMEYYRAEQVMIAAGIVSKDKVEQAHEIVRGLAHD